MGCAESWRIFERFSCALQWAAQHRGAAAVSHILDDFIFVGPSNSLNCLCDLQDVLVMSEEIYIPIKYSKINQPSTVIIVHGVQLDTIKWQASLPVHKVHKLLCYYVYA